MNTYKKTGEGGRHRLPETPAAFGSTGTPAGAPLAAAAIPRSTFIDLLSPRIRWHQIVSAIVDDELTIVLAAVLYGERPDRGVVGHPIAEKLCSIVQPRVALLLNHFRSGGDGFLHKLDDVGFGLESLARGIVALAEVWPDV